MSAVDVVQRQLEAYNAHDVDAMAATYAEDCIIADLNGEMLQRGRDAVRARYTKTFSDFPQNHADVVARMTLGDVVVDHEQGTRGPNGPTFEAIVVYTVKNGLIARADFIR